MGAEDRELAVHLHGGSGAPIRIATVTLTPDGDGYRYRIAFDETHFESHFLSMRPFKCVPLAPQLMCHVPYPYAKGQRISMDDLVDLEYDLLFIRKDRAEFGIDPWNGAYYRLRWTPDGGLEGDAFALDMDILAAPPEPGVERPITLNDLHAIDSNDPTFTELRIK